MSTPFIKLSAAFEALCLRSKEAKGPEERRIVLQDMADLIHEMDALLSVKKPKLGNRSSAR